MPASSTRRGVRQLDSGLEESGDRRNGTKIPSPKLLLVILGCLSVDELRHKFCRTFMSRAWGYFLRYYGCVKSTTRSRSLRTVLHLHLSLPFSIGQTRVSSSLHRRFGGCCHSQTNRQTVEAKRPRAQAGRGLYLECLRKRRGQNPTCYGFGAAHEKNTKVNSCCCSCDLEVTHPVS